MLNKLILILFFLFLCAEAKNKSLLFVTDKTRVSLEYSKNNSISTKSLIASKFFELDVPDISLLLGINLGYGDGDSLGYDFDSSQIGFHFVIHHHLNDKLIGYIHLKFVDLEYKFNDIYFYFDENIVDLSLGVEFLHNSQLSFYGQLSRQSSTFEEVGFQTEKFNSNVLTIGMVYKINKEIFLNVDIIKIEDIDLIKVVALSYYF